MLSRLGEAGRRHGAWAVERWARLVFPGQCPGCGMDASEDRRPYGLCPTCRAAFDAGGEACPRCGVFQARDAQVGKDRERQPEDEKAHGWATEAEVAWTGCDCHRGRLTFDWTVAIGPYRDVWRDAVLRMKRPAGERLADALSELLWERLENRPEKEPWEVAVPVPMHWRRRLSRGVNSAELLAEGLSRRAGLRLARRVLVRLRITEPQTSLPPDMRWRNVARAFGMRDREGVNGRHVLLVDDVLTTGATSSRCATLLKRAGAARVGLAVVARASAGD